MTSIRYFKNPRDNDKVYGFEPETEKGAKDKHQLFIEVAIKENWEEVTGKWPPPPDLSLLKADKADEMRMKCQSEIETGFSSNALGSSHHYGAKVTDQLNLNLVAEYEGNLWCQNSSGDWAFISHSFDEVKKVVADLHAHIQRNQSLYALMLSSIDSAKTQADLSELVWKKQ